MSNNEFGTVIHATSNIDPFGVGFGSCCCSCSSSSAAIYLPESKEDEL